MVQRLSIPICRNNVFGETATSYRYLKDKPVPSLSVNILLRKQYRPGNVVRQLALGCESN